MEPAHDHAVLLPYGGPRARRAAIPRQAAALRAADRRRGGLSEDVERLMDRRKFLLVTSAFAVLGDAAATPEEMSEAIRKVTGGAKLNNGRIALDLPSLVENGSTVPMTV